MWLIGLELFVALPLVLIVLWALRANSSKDSDD